MKDKKTGFNKMNKRLVKKAIKNYAIFSLLLIITSDDSYDLLYHKTLTDIIR